MCSNPQTSASSGSQAGSHKRKGGRDSPALGGGCMGEVLLALKGEQLSSFIYTKSHFLPFRTALLFQEERFERTSLCWLVYPSLPQPRPLLSPWSPPRPPGHCFQHKCWSHHGLFCLEVDRVFPDPGVRWAAGGNGSAPGHCGGERFLLSSRVNYTHICCLVAKSCLTLFKTLWTVAQQAPLSMDLPRQEY